MSWKMLPIVRSLFGVAILCVGALCETPAQALDKSYVFPVNEGNLVHYQRFLDGRDPLKINDFSGPNLNRHVFEFITFQRALHDGGCDCKVEYVPFTADTSHARAIAEVKAGREISHPVAGFDSDPRYAEGIYLSVPILNADEFYVGLYTHSERQDILSLRDKEAIHNLRYTASESWVVDMQVLRSYRFHVVPAFSWQSAIDMIRFERADIILQPVSPEPDFHFTIDDEGNRFLPIPGVKLNFPAGRRYFVSRNHPDGAEFLEVLNRGLQKLESSGYLRKGQIAAGVIDPRIKDWEVVR
ncbi:hypothetical protein [Roseibium sediminis]|uniref:hypothetical protein n=1 Tax=Roseibium sediminis TaxID=1775174 RepID=UPI00123C9DD4|nr:hypothetical protein [Roseibium sediminis]